MKGLFVQTTLRERNILEKIVKTRILGKNSKILGFQPQPSLNRPISFCSYISKEYRKTYGSGSWNGVVFETDSPVVYACPADTFELIRGGNWLPGHERFIFPSIEKMLEKYPSPAHFRKDFQEYFRTLNPLEVYPNNDADFAERLYCWDYTLKSDWLLNQGCNEITFPKPMKIKNCRIFNSAEELPPLLD